MKDAQTSYMAKVHNRFGVKSTGTPQNCLRTLEILIIKEHKDPGTDEEVLAVDSHFQDLLNEQELEGADVSNYRNKYNEIMSQAPQIELERTAPNGGHHYYKRGKKTRPWVNYRLVGTLRLPRGARFEA